MERSFTNRLPIIIILIISIISITSIMVICASFDPSDTREIGYEFLNSSGDIVPYAAATVVHTWNTIDNYYFDIDSGIQFSNYFNDYWTRNIFCLGYYSGDSWNKIACADELTNFNKMIDSDNATYVNITMWRDIAYNGYDLRLGINYYLGLNDKKLATTIYGKNIGVDIPYDLGFSWKTTDILIAGTANDQIEINNSYQFAYRRLK